MKYLNCKSLIATSVLALTLASGPVTAAPLILDAGWQAFDFTPAGSSWTAEEFTFSIADGNNAWLAVTDAFLSGDRFELFVNGASIGLTSAPASEGTFVGGNYNKAFAQPDWSSAEIMLGAGTYAVTGFTVASVNSSGGYGAGIQLSSQSLGGPGFELPTNTIPVPASLWLVLASLGGLVATRRRKMRATPASV